MGPLGIYNTGHGRIFYDLVDLNMVKTEGVFQTFFYEGPQGEERIVRRVGRGEVTFFEGRNEEERIVRKEHPRRLYVRYFEGRRGEEHMVRKEELCGRISFYNGPFPRERLVRREYKTKDTVEHFEGEYGMERLARSTHTKRGLEWKTVFYEGLPDLEHKVRVEFVSGYIEYYQGPQGREERVRCERPSSNKRKKVEEETTEKLCVVCISMAPTHAAVPCGHICVCDRCLQRVDKCPLCRTWCISYLRVFPL